LQLFELISSQAKTVSSTEQDDGSRASTLLSHTTSLERIREQYESATRLIPIRSTSNKSESHVSGSKTAAAPNVSPSYRKPFVEDDTESQQQPSHTAASRPSPPRRASSLMDIDASDLTDKDIPQLTILSNAASKPKENLPPVTQSQKRKHTVDSSPLDRSTELKRLKAEHTTADENVDFTPPVQFDDIEAEVDARIRAKDEQLLRDRERLRDTTAKRKEGSRNWIDEGGESLDRRKRSRLDVLTDNY